MINSFASKLITYKCFALHTEKRRCSLTDREEKQIYFCLNSLHSGRACVGVLFVLEILFELRNT